MPEPAACLAVLGSGSEVGKSVIVTALCRVFADHGMAVAPFKAQNMSNNSGVTPEGLEMGRAQIVQAEAARVAPHVDMNPVLLKPSSDIGSQVVLNGKAWRDTSSIEFYTYKEFLFSECCAAIARLRRNRDIVVLEGAGSCAEVNLMDRDIVNLRMAAHVQAPVILVADIDRGGVFAQIVGTLACLQPSQQARIKGFVINRFRGDIDLFQDGVAWIENRTGKPVLGVLPWFEGFNIEAEDAVVIEKARPFAVHRAGGPAVAVIKLPHISNFTDFDPLGNLEGLDMAYLKQPQSLEGFQAVILPGTKSTRSDLAWLHASGWTDALRRYADHGGHILGICGGYQMLGREVRDPKGVEGPPGKTTGLDLLPVETEMQAPKTTTRTQFTWNGIQGRGYEIHMGRTHGPEKRALVSIQSRNQQACDDSDGAVSRNGRVIGTYLHGLFDTPEVTRCWLTQIGLPAIEPSRLHGPEARDRAYELLAEHARRHLDIPRIMALVTDRRRRGVS